MTIAERLQPVILFRPELASLNAGSMNFALFHALERYRDFKYDWEKAYLAMTEDFIFPNTFKSMGEYLEAFRSTDTKPEFEAYDAGMVNNIAFLIQNGHTRGPVLIQFVMGILGGIGAHVKNLVFLVNYARRQLGEFHFSVCVAGRSQFPLGTPGDPVSPLGRSRPGGAGGQSLPREGQAGQEQRRTGGEDGPHRQGTGTGTRHTRRGAPDARSQGPRWGQFLRGSRDRITEP